MVPENINNKTTVFATLTLMLLPLSATSLMAIGTPNYASAQGLFEGLEREQSGEGVPGGQPADTGGGAVPLNDTTTAQRGDVQGGGGGNATNTTMTGAAGNATNTTMTGAAGNATNTTMTGAAGNATNTTMTGAAGNATNTGDGGTTAVGNQTGGGQ